MVSLILAIIFVFVTFSICESRKYDNNVLYQVLPTRKDHLQFLKNLERKKYIDVVFWKRPYKLYQEVQFIASKNDTELLMERVNHYELPIHILEQDIQKLFDGQTIKKYERLRVHSFTWDYYHSLEDIYQWLQDISLQYSSLIKLELIGKSAQQKEIYSVAIRRNKAVKKPKVIIEAGTHGHEWISPMFATYIINELVQSYKAEDPRILELSNAYDWYIIPLVNPDGYEYSQTEDRMWRKNRRMIDGKSVGVDLDKNFNYSFGMHDASTDPSSDFYCGSTPFSEPESAAVANFIIKNANNLRFFFSIHAYGQMFILPYSDQIKRLDNYREIENYAKQAISKIFRVTGKKYYVGTNYDMRGLRSSGDSVSWVKKTFQPRYSAALVLRDTGRKGFALPPEDIQPTCKEGMIGLVELMTAKTKFLRANIFRFNAAVRGVSRFPWCFVNLLVILLIWN